MIVGGCGRVGAELSGRLSEDRHVDVVAIDIEPSAFDRLGTAFNGEILVGDITDRDVLEQAGVERSDALVATTRSDNANLMAVEIASVLYGVPTAVARLFDPERESVYHKLGVRYVSGTGILVKLFLNQIRGHELPQHVDFEHGDVAVVDIPIGAAGHGQGVAELERDGRLRVAAVQRGSRVWIPREDDTLREGDVATAALRHGALDAVRDLVRRPGRLEDQEPHAGAPSGPRTAAGSDDPGTGED